MKTAVGWLFKELVNHYNLKSTLTKEEILNQAKEIEKKQGGYSEEDMKKCWDACLSFNKPSGLDSGVNFKNFIKQLKNK